MPPLRRLAGPLLVGVLLLGPIACDEGPSTLTRYMHPTGAFDFLAGATRNQGPLYLEIDGLPLGESEGLESRVATVMEQAVQSRVLRLTTDQNAAEDPRFRLVLVFNPAQGGGDLFAFCREQPAGGPPDSGGRIELRAGFCRGDDLLAAVDGWAEEIETLDDPKVEQLMRQVARDLFSRNRSDD
ncbi:hypothetical protein AAFN88_21550 [Pelagibius sp. CAU 1746]|uniref:hypothetical protein n=1 Tax=Pelagibius sp. CAU 1746 TaxID=3140370 RepID=UPI00325C2866